jgi:hypothetical protein
VKDEGSGCREERQDYNSQSLRPVREQAAGVHARARRLHSNLFAAESMTDLELLQEFSAYVRGTKPLPTSWRRYIDCYLHSSIYDRRSADADGPVWYEKARRFRQRQGGFAALVGQFIPAMLVSELDGTWPSHPDRLDDRWTADVFISLTEPVVVTIDLPWPHPIMTVPSPPGTVDRITFVPIVRGHSKHVTLIGWDTRTGGTHVLELVVREYYP